MILKQGNVEAFSNSNGNEMKQVAEVYELSDGLGVSVSVTGMITVFCGLILISLAIVILPKLVLFITTLYSNRRQILQAMKQVREPFADDGNDLEDEVAAVIGLILHLEKERSGGRGIGDIWGTPGKTDVTLKRRLSA